MHYIHNLFENTCSKLYTTRIPEKQKYKHSALAGCWMQQEGKSTIMECNHLEQRENGRPLESCTLSNGRTAVDTRDVSGRRLCYAVHNAETIGNLSGKDTKLDPILYHTFKMNSIQTAELIVKEIN